MNLTKTYRGKKTEVTSLYIRQFEQGITFSTHYNGNSNAYTFKVDVFDYLKVAKKAVAQLKRVSGMDYCIMAKHPDSTTWRAL